MYSDSGGSAARFSAPGLRYCSALAAGERGSVFGRGADDFDRDHFSFPTNARSAWPRCDSAFFSSGVSSAADLPSDGSQKCGS